MVRNLESDMQTLRSVLELTQKRDFSGAAALAERTLAGGFEHPMLLNVAATRLEQQGRYDQALKLLERAVAIAPNDVGARNALGLCLQRLDRPADALVQVDEVLRQDPQLSFAHAGRGNALIAMGLLGPARESHLRAVQIEPGNFGSLSALASIAIHRGQNDEARQWAERALALAPGFPDAVLSLAAAEMATGKHADAQSRLRQLISDHRSGPTDRARATGLLADILDADGRYAEAFEAYQASNVAFRQIHQRFAGANVAGYTRAVTAAVDHLDPGRWQVLESRSQPDASDQPSGHVFLLGFPRTGTTLIDVVLDGSPEVVSLEEHELLADGVMRFMREPLDFGPLAGADEAAVEALRRDYWRRVRAAGIEPAGKLFIDKHPLNTLKLPLIAKLFPQARILFAMRDPRDVIFSCFRRRFQMNPSMYEFLTLPGTAAFYAATMQLAQSAKRVLGLTWHEVRYERLVTDFEREMRGICEFIGLEWNREMGDFAQRSSARERATPSTAQLSQGLVTSAHGQWQHYETQLAPVLPTLAPWLQLFDYA